MTKKMISWLSFMAVFCLIIYSCRTDESIYEKHDRSETDKIEAFSKFESHLPSVNTTGKSCSEYVSYHEPFKEIIQNFMNNNPEYAERFQREAGDIYFDLRSFTYGETTKGLAYPIMKDGIVNAVLIAMVNEKRDWVTFIVLKNSSPEVTSMIAKFQKFYDALGKAKGREQMQEEQIEEVVIVIYQSIPGPSYIYYQPYTDYGSSIGLGSGMSGGPTIHQGGGFYNPPQTPPNPCEKLKAQITNVNYKAKIEALDKSSILSLKKETGYAESKSGVFTELPQAASTANSDGLTVTVTPSLKGYIHTHINDYSTGTYNDEGESLIRQPIRMFSPADVNTLMEMVGMATDGNYSELYGTMVSSYGNYTIMFSGTASDIKTGFDTQKWADDYVEYRKKNQYWSFEKLFLNFLKDKMNVQGIELYKIKNNGIVQKKTLNSNNNVQSSDCPQ